MIGKQIKKLQAELTEVAEKNKEILEELKTEIQNLIDASAPFGKNWIGEWGADSYNYYNNFVEPQKGGYIAPSKQEIIDYANHESKQNLSEISDRIFAALKDNQEVQDNILTELSLIKGDNLFKNEEELLDSIENYQWGISSKDYVDKFKPKSIYTRNPGKVLNKGLQTPPHFSVDGELVSLFSIIAAIDDFQKASKRLFRQIELKTELSDSGVEIEEHAEHIYNIINKFHIVSNQLLNRYNNRETIKINDEYDVQDLMHALLKQNFDDVRPEEYTPSYAGSSTRVDFLLKKEKIVIEVKKTRKGLDDKEVGNQLILDSLHYKVHPDCKHLICFVYDPENRIKNPRGLESDLNELSNDDLLVEAFIRP